MNSNLRARAAVAAVCAALISACSSGAQHAPVIPALQTGRSAAAVLSASTLRPISQFVNVQGTYCSPDSFGVPPGAQDVNGCVIFVPPIKNFEGWGTPKNTAQCPTGIPLASVDYAGLADQYLTSLGKPLGTATSGTITESPLSGGGYEVTVNLHTKNALAWAGCDPNGTTVSFNFATAQLFFGNRAPQVAQGAPAALATSQLQLKFTELNKGDPMPDLLQLLAAPGPGQNLETMKFYATANGELHAAFGVTDGTPGHLVVAETATLKTTGKAAADAFTAEEIHITAK